MCSVRRHIFFLPLLFCPLLLLAEAPKRPPAPRGDAPVGQVHMDSVIMPINYREKRELSNEFYDSLENRTYKSAIARLLARSLIRGRDASDEGTPSTQLTISRAYFERFSGRRITDVQVTQANIYSVRDTTIQQKWWERFADNMHVRTREAQFNQNFFFAAGDTVNAYVMAANEEYLRNLPYLSTAYFVVTPDLRDTSGVVVHVFARDNWSISGDLDLGHGRNYAALFDRNFLGTGDELMLRFYCEKLIENPGIELDYTVRNLLGSFADLTVRLGVGNVFNVGMIDVQRPFLLPDDRAWGATVGSESLLEGALLTDTTYDIRRSLFSGWYGKSWCLDWGKGTTIYLAGSYEKVRFQQRPDVSPRVNPYYHDRELVLMNIGYARKNYFQGNMIYGYGRTEDIPYGFKTELVSGLEWNAERGTRPYFGGGGYWGDLTRIGYLGFGAAVGGYLNNRRFEQGAVAAQVRYFSPLFQMGRSNYLRQFLFLSGNWGINRLEQEREGLRYRSDLTVRGLQNSVELQGYNRLVMSSETVWFTPLYLYHFRFAFFTFGDLGWLGYENNPFKNVFTGSLGLGVRIKNERLIFNNVQIRLGVAFNRPPEVGYSYFSVQSERTVHDMNFSPGRPHTIDYR